MLFSHEGKDRSFRENAFAAIALSGVAGFVNSAGFLAVGVYTSHVTGSVSHLASAGAEGAWSVMSELALLVGAFFFGAFASSMMVELTNLTRWRNESRFALPFLVQVGILTAIAAWGFTHGDLDGWLKALGIETGFPSQSPPPLQLFAYALSASMGMQNALLTRVSGAVVRTTHLTGVVTDLGLETAGLVSAVLQWIRHRWLGGTQRSLHSVLDLRRFLVHGGIVLSFVTCGVAGALAYRAVGYASFLFPAVALLMLGMTSVMRLAIESQERLWSLVTTEVPWRRGRNGLRLATRLFRFDRKNSEPVKRAERPANDRSAGSREVRQHPSGDRSVEPLVAPSPPAENDATPLAIGAPTPAGDCLESPAAAPPPGSPEPER